MSRSLAFFLIALITILLFLFSHPFPLQKVKVWVFDVGQGDAIFIDAPHKQMLIDGGPDEKVLEQLSAVMPWWDRSIDIVVNTHPHADHLNGILPILERYQVSQVLDDDQGYSTPEYAEYVSLARSMREVLGGDVVIDLGDGVHLQTVWPLEPYNKKVLDDPNDGSLVFLLTYKNTSMLLTGDAGIEQEQGILEHYCADDFAVGSVCDALHDVDVLKVGHHGSDTSTSQDFLDVLKPQVAIISVGADNDYGHPSTFVIDRLWQSGATVYRTDLNGTIGVFLNGSSAQVVEKSF